MSAPAGPLSAVAAMTAMELRLVLRRPENLFATIIIPTLVLVLFSSIGILPTGTARGVDFLLPGSIALGVVATSLVSLSITTAYDRSYGVLKRLGGSPLSRSELIAARLLTVLAVELVQVGLLVGTATWLLGWTAGPGGSPQVVAIAVLAGTAAFAGLGLILAGTLRAETVLAVANILFLAFLVVGGVVVPIDRLPGPLVTFAAALPAAPLTELLRAGLASAGTAATASDVGSQVLLLAGWAIATTGLAARTFRWE
ncbi:MAG: type transport system permease protein [Chloroflexota bacterium]|jgi:ABC-2 type transport system permease protein|nr:type transport system permease protein [Chloroflexota bacterium]